MDGGRDHALRHGPLVAPDDDPDPPVDFRPADTRFDDGLANRLELERPKVPGQLVAIEFSNRLDGISDVENLVRHPAVLDVVGLGPSEERQKHLAVRHVGPISGARSGEGSAVGQPLPDDPVVLGPALPGPIFAQVEIPAAEGNDRSARRLVEAVARCTDGTGQTR